MPNKSGQCTGQDGFNPLKHRFDGLLRPRAPSDPSTADARRQVVGSTCNLASLFPAPKLHSDRPRVDHLDRQVYACCLTDVGAHVLVGAAQVSVSLRNVRASRPLPPGCCRGRAGKRSQAPWPASADAHPSCVPSATVRASLTPGVAESRIPRPTASIGTSSRRRRGQSGSAGRPRGGGAWRLDDHSMVYARRRARRC